MGKRHWVQIPLGSLGKIFQNLPQALKVHYDKNDSKMDDAQDQTTLVKGLKMAPYY